MKPIIQTGALSALLLCLPFAPAAHAEETGQELQPIQKTQPEAEQQDEFSIGVGAGYADSGYRGKSADWTVLPLVQLETKRFYIRGLSAGVKLYTSANQSQEVLLGATYLRDYGLKPSDSDDARIKRLDRRKNAVMADLGYNLYSPYGNLETQVSHDISGKNKGMMAKMQYSYFWQPTSKLFVKPAVGVSYSNQKFNRYYYGINAEESRRSGLNTYQPKSSVHPYISLETQYDFTPKFSVFGGVLAEALSSTVKNSPMNDGKYRLEGAAGVKYRF